MILNDRTILYNGNLLAGQSFSVLSTGIIRYSRGTMKTFPPSTRIERNGDAMIVVPVLQDNFVYLVCRGHDAVVIDAGETQPVEAVLGACGLQLRAALLTHRHGDHAAGYTRMQQLVQGQVTSAPGPVEVLMLPGHTEEDMGFYFPVPGVVFTGDCLINGACGRVLGGSFGALYASLQRIKQLPADTLVCGGHDYLLDNLRFAQSCEPTNTAIQERMERYAQDPAGAVFVTLEEEKTTNPFLRVPDLEAFITLRKAKDRFR
jgi:hydroxyacylglutathione hydrolase